MAQVLAAVPIHGLDAVLVAAELALEAGKPSGEHVLNVLARLKDRAPAANLSQAAAAERVHSTLKLRVEPTANMARYDGLRQSELAVQAVERQIKERCRACNSKEGWLEQQSVGNE